MIRNEGGNGSPLDTACPSACSLPSSSPSLHVASAPPAGFWSWFLGRARKGATTYIMHRAHSLHSARACLTLRIFSSTSRWAACSKSQE
eukprot:2176883-Pleurochrysis_carterae.AAC.3